MTADQTWLYVGEILSPSQIESVRVESVIKFRVYIKKWKSPCIYMCIFTTY